MIINQITIKKNKHINCKLIVKDNLLNTLNVKQWNKHRLLDVFIIENLLYSGK